MPTLDDITGQYFASAKSKLKDGYYVKCKKCGAHERLRGKADEAYKYPPKYAQTKSLGSCGACHETLDDRIFLVLGGRIQYMIVRQEIRISKKLREISPAVYSSLNEHLKQQLEPSTQMKFPLK